MSRGPSPFTGRKPSTVNSAVHPGAIGRFLFSCGYVTDKVAKVGDWFTAKVFHRDSRVPMGQRWVRPKLEGGYEIRKTDPRGPQNEATIDLAEEARKP